MKRIKILVKPTNRCNLHCSYCYNRGFNGRGIMTLKMVEDICRFLQGFSVDSWIWHGGEPLIIPREFYSIAAEILSAYGIKKDSVSMQSNGTLLTEEMIELCKENNWRIGFSFDGINNDRTRGQTGTVINNLQLYRDLYEQPGIIMVLCKDNLPGFSDNYQYMKELGFSNISINRIFAAQGAPLFQVEDIDQYMEEYSRLFELWFQDEKPLKIRNYLEFILYLLDNKRYLCTYQGLCDREWISIDHRGDLYPCDRWYPPEYCYGNIADFNNIEEIYQTALYSKIGQETSIRKEKCRSCDIFVFCQGGCKANAITNKGTPDQIDCEIRRREVSFLFDRLKNLDQYKVPNPQLRRELQKIGFRNLSFIKALQTKGGHLNE